MNRDKVQPVDTLGGMDAGAWTALRTRTGGQVLRPERWLARRMVQHLDHPPIRLTLWDGQPVFEPRPQAVARLTVGDRGALYRLLYNPEFEFGELYSAGRLQVDGDLVGLLEAFYRATSSQGTFRRHAAGWRHRLFWNTRRRSRLNVANHYDIGNEFYRLWLDEAMAYTCAYFPTDTTSLEAAQVAKMEHVSRKLRLQPGQSVIEAGCGWGALAIHMAEHHGVSVRAYNISREQVAWARDLARRKRLDGRVEFIEDDYRNITGRCDAFVSVGMLEHVGPRHYGELGRVIDRCLSPTGMGLIHTIGRNRPLRPNAWIAARIFPGGYTPALSEITPVFEPNAFSILDVENLRLHYALTLRHWLERFERSADAVRSLFDERFVRMWRLYLAGSLAAFTTGWMQLFQVVFTRSGNNDLPLTREHLYRPQ